MFMFYKIDNDYYVLVGNKYVQVRLEVKDNDVNAIPLDKKIERDININAVAQPFNDDFKKQIINKNKPKIILEEDNENDRKGRNRFGR